MTRDATDSISITAEDKPFDGKCPVCGEDDWYVNDDEENECNNCSHVLEDEEDPEPTCEWRNEEDSWGGNNHWVTKCNEAFHFECDGVTDNKFRFCPYCGKPIKVM